MVGWSAAVVTAIVTLGLVIAGLPLLGSDLASSGPIALLDADADEGVVVHGVGGQPLPLSAFQDALPLFVQRYVGNAEGFEPTMGVTQDGTMYYMGMKGDVPPVGVQEVDQYATGYTPEVWRSSNGGLTWKDVSPGHLDLPIVPHAVTSAAQGPFSSGDPYLHVDVDTGRVFTYHQQTYLLCDHFAISSTAGETWEEYTTCPEMVTEDESFGDHPTLVTAAPRVHDTEGYENLVHFCSSSGCRRSTDGGFSWSSAVAPFTECAVQLGHIKAAPDGTLYLPRKACGGTQVAVSEDDGATWTTKLVDDTVWSAADEPWDGWDHESAVTTDAEGNVYYFWMGNDRLPYLAVSQDKGDTWTEPMMVGAPDVTYSLFPEIVAGDAGRVAFLYFGTEVESGTREDPNGVWNAYVGFSVNALDTSPVFATAVAHDPSDPLRRGTCHNFRCYVGEGPLGNGALTDGVGDFLDIDIDPTTGRVVVPLVDLCNGTCSAPDGTPDDRSGMARAAAGVQIGGVRLFIE